MRVQVDADRCSGHGRCWTVASSVFAPDDQGFVSKTDDLVEVPEGAEAGAVTGVQSCPERALTVVE